MSATVTPAVERVSIPCALRFYDHQQECLKAYRAGARRMIWRHHRQSGKGLGALALTAMSAFERPGTYALVSPTHSLSRENFWDARDPDTGQTYLDLVLPAQLVLDRNEVEMALVIATSEPGKTSRIVFRSADDPDRLRGPAYAGVVLDEYATQTTGAALDVVRIPLERAGGWLLLTSTPKGIANHFCTVWKNAEAAGGWYLSTKTILDTRRHDGQPIIPMSHVEQEKRENQRETWLRQEFFVEFTSDLVGSYYSDVLTKCEAEGRIADWPHRPEWRVWTAWDLGIADATAVIYVQAIGEWLHVINAETFEGLGLDRIIPQVQRHGYMFERHLAPHDIEVRDFTHGASRKEFAARLGFHFRTVPRLAVQDGVDALRRMFGRLRFDRRHCGPLLEALGAYSKAWDPRAKMFRDTPLHSPHSHYADAARVFAVGYREKREDDDGRNRPQQYAGGSLNPWKPIPHV